MTQQTENHPARLLFDLLLDEIRQLVRNEITIVREEIKAIARNKQIPAKPQRFYTVKEAATELKLSSATVHRLIIRGLLRPSKATRHIRIPSEQIDEFTRTTI